MVELPKASKTMASTRPPVSKAPSLTTPITYLPAGFLISAPGRLAVSFGGTGSVQFTVAGIIPASASFGGTASVDAGGIVQVMESAPEFAGAGGMSAVTVTYLSSEVTFGGDGGFVAEAEEFVGLPVVFGGPGGVSVLTAPFVASGFGGSGGMQLGPLSIPQSFGGSGGLVTNLGLTGSAGAMFGGTGGLSVVVTTFEPSGMTKNGTSPATTGWTVVPNWLPNTETYPGSSVDGSHRLVVQGGKTNASLDAAVPFSSAIFGTTHRIRLVDQSGNVLVTGASVGSGGTSGTCTASATGVDLTGVTAIGIQMDGSGASGTITSGSTCYFTIT